VQEWNRIEEQVEMALDGWTLLIGVLVVALPFIVW
jgi:hypothetical protein